MQVDVAPLEAEEDRPGDDARHQGAAQAHPGVGDNHVEEGEHHPDHHHREEPREQGVAPSVVLAEQLAGVVAHGVGQDPEDRHDHHHGNVVGVLARDAALDLHLPDVVEGALDRGEDADHRPEEHHQRHGGHDATLCAGQRLFGEGDDVVDRLGALREEGIEVFGQLVREAEALHDGEDHRDDGDQRHERIEGQRRAADGGPVLQQPARRVEQQPVLLDEPPHDGIPPFVEAAAEDRVGEIGRYVA